MNTATISANGNGHHPLTLRTQHDRAAEAAVLGSVLIDPASIYQVSGFLRPDHFYLVQNRLVYEELLSLASKREPIDFLTLSSRMDRHDPPPKDGWEVYIMGLFSDQPTSYHITSYARIVEEHAIRRAMVRAAEKIGALSLEDGDIDAQLSQAEMAIFGIRQGRTVDGVHTPREYVSAALDDLHQRMTGDIPPGLPTGFIDLDKLLGGIKAPFPYLIAGRPGMGKSAFCGDIARHLAVNQDKAVMFFAAEMTERQMVQRLWAGMADVDLTRIQNGTLTDQEHSRILNAAGRLSECRLFIDASAGLTPGQVRARAMRYHAEHRLDLIIVDHLHRMSSDDNRLNRNLELGDMMRSLVDTGKHIEAPVMIAAQLSRGVEGRNNKRPQLADLRESGALEEEAYAVLFLYRDDYYNPDLSERPNICEVEVAKHRDGPTGTADLYWRGRITSFRSLQRSIEL